MHPHDDPCRGSGDLPRADRWRHLGSGNGAADAQQETDDRGAQRLSEQQLFRRQGRSEEIRCFRHQVLLRRDRHVHDRSSGHPARVSERQHVA